MSNTLETDFNYREFIITELNDEFKRAKRFNNDDETYTSNPIEIDLTKIKLVDALELLNTIDFKKDGRKFIKILNVEGTSNYINLSNSNILKLIDFQKALNTGTFEEPQGSDERFMRDVMSKDKILITMKNITLKNKNKKGNGGFFKYYHKLKDVDLLDLGIYHEDDDERDYSDNCLYQSLKVGGLEEAKLNELKYFTKSGYIPVSSIKHICDKLKISIKITRQRITSDKNYVVDFGKEYNKIYNIGLIDDHYFIIKDNIPITRYAIENYEDINHLKKYNEIFAKREKNGNLYFERDAKRFINSFTLIKLLLTNKEKVLRPIPIQDILETQYHNTMIDNDNLEYNSSCIKENNPMTMDRTNCYRIFFDFETDTSLKDDDDIPMPHEPYLMCYITQDEQQQQFLGRSCGIRFIDNIKKMFENEPMNDKGIHKEVLLIAHNCRYDFTFILNYLYNLNPLLKGGRLMGGDAVIWTNKKMKKMVKNKETGEQEERIIYGRIKIHFQDSLNLIPKPLRDFKNMFALDMKKEILPYSIYTTYNIMKRYLKKDYVLEFIDDDNKDEFLKNCGEWKCLVGDDLIDMIEYSSKYCDMDCVVLKNGYDKFRTWIKEVCKIDIVNYCSLASLSFDYLVREGCFEDCHKISGRPLEFLQRFVVGGRCMSSRNEKQYVVDKINDFDGVSLYPSSMVRFDGVLKGQPKVIADNNKNIDWLKSVSGYFVKVRCLNNTSINRDFPLLSDVDENGVRQFTNETMDKVYYLDKVGLEDAINFQGLDFEIICGYYYDEGHNNKINQVIQYLFEERAKQKALGNPIQEVFKLLMNSSYGKCMLKPIGDEIKIIADKKFDDYLARNYNFIVEMFKLENSWLVKVLKPIDNHFNNVYCGIEILSMSKRIMSEVICLGEDIGCSIYYTDTDSIHLLDKDISRLAETFKLKYNRELIGKKLGQFHTDFSLEGCKDVYSKKLIVLGKKCYVDVLVGTDKESGELKDGLHIRMKGVSEGAINYYAEHHNISVENIYEKLYNREELNFDLLCGGKKVRFEYGNDLMVRSINAFNRSLTFLDSKEEKQEYIKNKNINKRKKLKIVEKI